LIGQKKKGLKRTGQAGREVVLVDPSPKVLNFKAVPESKEEMEFQIEEMTDPHANLIPNSIRRRTYTMNTGTDEREKRMNLPSPVNHLF